MCDCLQDQTKFSEWNSWVPWWTNNQYFYHSSANEQIFGASFVSQHFYLCIRIGIGTGNGKRNIATFYATIKTLHSFLITISEKLSVKSDTEVFLLSRWFAPAVKQSREMCHQAQPKNATEWANSFEGHGLESWLRQAKFSLNTILLIIGPFPSSNFLLKDDTSCSTWVSRT